ncbi:MAG: hypothetical protein ABIW76_10060 [Fibrobacteria bacterium]
MPVPAFLKSVPALLLAILLCIWLGAPPAVSGFVFLDTSEPGKPKAKDSVAIMPPAAATEPVLPVGGPTEAQKILQPLPAPVAARKAAARYGNVMFLSADNKLVYAYLGVWKALEEFGLAPDAMIAESKALLLGAAWAMGYSAASMEAALLRSPLEDYLQPHPFDEASQRNVFLPAGPDPIQWDIPLGLQSLQTSTSRWKDVTVGETGEFLHLSWMVARLTHDAPGGPVEDLSRSPRPLAVQVTDLVTEREAVLTEGGLQGILKGALLPAGVVRKRPRLWPFASGSLLSGHTVMTDKLPFGFERLILVQPGHSLRPPALERAVVPWTDSLNLRTMRRNSGASWKDGGAAGEGTGIIRIELEPEGSFNPEETDPRKWIQLGYTSTLRSMDVLRSVLGKDSLRGGSGYAGAAVDSAALKPQSSRLGLNRLSVNPLASGGRQLLLDIIRISERDREDTSGEGAIEALENSGFYSELDLEWAQGTGEEKSVLVFDAREKSKIRFRAGWNAVFAGEELPYRPPEVYGGLSWSEPFYIPFKGEVGALLGGHRPGYETRFMIAPVYPLHLELGVSRTHWELLYPYESAPRSAQDAGDFWMGLDANFYELRLERTLSEVFLKVFPWPSAYLRTAIQKHAMRLPVDTEPENSEFLSTDFEETVFLGLGKPDPIGSYPHSLRLRYKNLNRVNLFGPVKFSTSNFESRLSFRYGNFRFSDQFFWSDQSNQDLSVFDVMEAGRMEVFTFQDEYFMAYLRSANFQDAKIEYAPTFGKAGIRIIVGAYRNYAPALFEAQAQPHLFEANEIPFTPHWEAQVGYTTPLGVLRVGAGAIDGSHAFYYLKLGAGLDLGFEGNR